MRSGTAILLLTGSLGPVGGLAGQTMAETKAWLESDGTSLAISSSDTSLTNVRMISYTTSAVLTLDDCRLTISMTDNSGVSGSRTTMVVPLKEVNTGGVGVVARPEGYHDFIYVLGKYFVTIPARAPDSYPFLNISGRGELRSSLATIPARDTEAGSLLASAVRRAAELCGAPAPPP
jgi:hypothetical protein